MDFLVDAIFSLENSSFCGANVLHYDFEPYYKRPVTQVLDALQFESAYKQMNPVGFEYNAERKELRSDTQMRRAVANEVTDYIMANRGRENREGEKKGLTDVVLWALGARACVCPNYEEAKEDSEVIFVPMRSFCVSHSSFNIYSPYKRADGEYRTISLVDSEDFGVAEFYLAVPSILNVEFDSGLNALSSVMEEVGKLQREGDVSYKIYKVFAPLRGSSKFCGEAFTNYLAYLVMMFDTGNRIIQRVIKAVDYDENKPEKVEVKPMQLGEKRKPRANVAIEHEYMKADWLVKALEVISLGNDKIMEFMQREPSSIPTLRWVDTIMQSKVYENTFNNYKKEEDDIEAVIRNAFKWSALNMLPECREYLLVYGCELLDVRYFLYKIGIVNDPIGGGICNGGGVIGSSIIKRSYV